MKIDEFFVVIVLLVLIVAGYRWLTDDPEPPLTPLTCGLHCYRITLDDGTKCRVWRGEHIPNRDWPMLCEFNGVVMPYEEYKAIRSSN